MWQPGNPCPLPLRMWRLSAPSLSWATLWTTAFGQLTPRPAFASLSPSPSTTLLLRARTLSSAGWRWSEWRWREKSRNPLRPTAAILTTTTFKKHQLIAHKTGRLKKDTMWKSLRQWCWNPVLDGRNLAGFSVLPGRKRLSSRQVGKRCLPGWSENPVGCSLRGLGFYIPALRCL